MLNKAVGLILAGGLSRRLFPMSQSKSLLRIGESTLLEETFERLRDIPVSFVVSSEPSIQMFNEYFQSKKKKLPDYIVEPEPRDTAAAVGFALRSLKNKPEWVVVLSSDQLIKDNLGFRKFLKLAEEEISKFPNALFVAGSPSKSKPKDAHSSFGWIVPEKNQKKTKAFSSGVKCFVEKPKAQKLIGLRNQGGLINAGMFFGRYQTFVQAYEEFYPEVLKVNCNYSKLKREPIDRAIFEKHQEVRVIPFPLAWEDLGTWQMIAKHLGSHPFVNAKSKSSFVWDENGDKEIHIYGMEDVAVVHSGNRIMVMPLSETAHLKKYLKD